MKHLEISNKKNTLIEFSGLSGGLYNMEDFKLGQDIPRAFTATSGTPVINGDTISLLNEISDIRNVGYWVVGKRYKIQAEVSNYSGAGLIILPYDGNVVGLSVSANGVYSYEYTPANTICFIYSAAGHTATVKITSIREIQIADNSGNNNDLSVYNSLVKSTIGSIPAMVMNGTTNFLSRSASLGVLTQFSVAFLLRATAPTSDSAVSLYSGSDYGLNIIFDANKKLAVLFGGSIYATTDKAFTGEVNSIFVVTYNAGVLKIYENGVSLSFTTTGTIPTSYNTAGMNMEIARWNSGGYAYTTGKFGTVCFSTKLLTSAEVSTISNRLLFLAQNVGKWNANSATALGANIIVNGNFDADLAWTRATGVTIANGKLNISAGAGANTSQNLGITILNKQFKVTTYVTDYTSGYFNVTVGGYNSGANINSVGVFTQFITVSNVNSNNIFYIYNGGNFVGSIKAIIVQEVHEKYTPLSDSNFLGVFNLPSGDISAISGVVAVDSAAGKYYDATNHLIYAPLPIVNKGTGIRNVGQDYLDNLYTMNDNYMEKYNMWLSYFEKAESVTSGKALAVSETCIAVADSQVAKYLFIDFKGIRYNRSGIEIPPFKLTDSVYDDILFPLIQGKQGANAKPDIDYTNCCLLFPQNDATEKVYIVAQLSHAYREGSDIRPHIHWLQKAATNVIWKLDYCWYNNGDSGDPVFTTLVANANADSIFPYVSGTLQQITQFPAISGTGKKISSILLMKFYREDNVTTGDVSAVQFDLHFEKDSLGSGAVYAK